MHEMQKHRIDVVKEFETRVRNQMETVIAQVSQELRREMRGQWVYVHAGGANKMLRQEKRDEIIQDYKSGMTESNLVKKHKVSKSTIHRIARKQNRIKK